MARQATVPHALSGALVTLDDARRHGLGPWRMRTKAWQRIAPGTYLPADVTVSPELRIEAASRRLPDRAAFSGFTAAWLHGLDVEPCNPIEITVAAPANVSARSGMKVRRRALPGHELGEARGYRVTSMLRTLHDLCRRLDLTEGVVLLDEALHRRLISVQRLQGAGSMTQLIGHAEPKSESPMETRLRMRLVLAGLPRPLAQVPIYDGLHRFVGRPDLYYPDQHLGLEYDGGTHRSTLAQDNRRQNALLHAGVRLLRFTAGDVWVTPDKVVADVRQALGIISPVR